MKDEGPKPDSEPVPAKNDTCDHTDGRDSDGLDHSRISAILGSDAVCMKCGYRYQQTVMSVSENEHDAPDSAVPVGVRNNETTPGDVDALARKADDMNGKPEPSAPSKIREGKRSKSTPQDSPQDSGEM